MFIRVILVKGIQSTEVRVLFKFGSLVMTEHHSGYFSYTSSTPLEQKQPTNPTSPLNFLESNSQSSLKQI